MPAILNMQNRYATKGGFDAILLRTPGTYYNYKQHKATASQFEFGKFQGIILFHCIIVRYVSNQHRQQAQARNSLKQRNCCDGEDGSRRTEPNHRAKSLIYDAKY